MPKQLPAWLIEQWEGGESDGTPARNRAEERRNVTASCFVRVDESSEPVLAHIFNMNLQGSGIGLIVRKRLDPGQDIMLIPSDGDGEPVKAHVVHCTQTVQGYKIGCSVE
ncbi:MAG TPA: PilZ domain-containing protein [Gammaproteobacteria bacterium]|nr:PilZ domain-containing protein [Gammaproteobacteria bacterium]